MNLSIIVPVYNMAADNKLVHCLDSLINQAVEEYEIIAVDDASTDESLDILNEYKERYPNLFRVIALKENRKQGGARNAGMREAKGKWIGFMDSDDWASPEMFKKLLDKAKETAADFVGCDYTIVDHYTFDLGRRVVNNTLEQTGLLDVSKHKLHILNPGSMVVKIYSRDVIEKNNLCFPEEIFYEDNAAAPVWSMYFTHFERVDEALYYYLTVPSSTTHNITWDKCLDRIKAGDIMLEECLKRSVFEQYKTELEFRYGEVAYAGTLFSYMYGGKKRSIANVKYLQDLSKKRVEDFVNNPYFSVRLQEEDRKLIKLHLKSYFVFYIYYRLLFGYRNIRKKLNL